MDFRDIDASARTVQLSMHNNVLIAPEETIYYAVYVRVGRTCTTLIAAQREADSLAASLDAEKGLVCEECGARVCVVRS